MAKMVDNAAWSGDKVNPKTYSPAAEIKGNLIVTIGKGAIVKNADASPTANRAENNSITYDVTSINSANIRNFTTVQQTGEGTPPPATGSYIAISAICAILALGGAVAIVTKKRKLDD